MSLPTPLWGLLGIAHSIVRSGIDTLATADLASVVPEAGGPRIVG